MRIYKIKIPITARVNRLAILDEANEVGYGMAAALDGYIYEDETVVKKRGRKADAFLVIIVITTDQMSILRVLDEAVEAGYNLAGRLDGFVESDDVEVVDDGETAD